LNKRKHVELECAYKNLKNWGYNVNDTPVIEALPSEEPNCELEQQVCNEAQVTNEEVVTDEEQVSDEVVLSETVMEAPTPEVNETTEAEDNDDISTEDGNEDEDEDITPFFKIIPPKTNTQENEQLM